MPFPFSILISLPLSLPIRCSVCWLVNAPYSCKTPFLLELLRLTSKKRLICPITEGTSNEIWIRAAHQRIQSGVNAFKHGFLPCVMCVVVCGTKHPTHSLTHCVVVRQTALSIYIYISLFQVNQLFILFFCFVSPSFLEMNGDKRWLSKQ